MNDINLHTAVTKPRLQPTVIAVPLPGERLAIHRGTKQAAGYVVVEDPGGWRATALGLMDGSRTVEQIASSLESSVLNIDRTELASLVKDLGVSGVLLDATAFERGPLRDDEMQRYSRNLNGWAALATDGRTPAEVQHQLGKGHVLMLGAGGLGSVASVSLTMAGCKKITVLDFDHVDLTNLNRQLFATSDVGDVKVAALKKRLNAINPDTEVNIIETRLMGPDHVKAIIAEVKPDIVVAAIDRPVIAADRWISDACCAVQTPFICNSVSAGTGMVWSKIPGKTGCFTCDELWSRTNSPDHHAVRQYRELNDIIPGTSAFSFGAMAVGAMITSEVIRYLVDLPMASAGKLVVLDFASLTTTVFEKPAYPDCPVCGGLHKNGATA